MQYVRFTHLSSIKMEETYVIPEYAWKSVNNLEIPKNSYVCGYSPYGNIYIGLVNYRGYQYPARIIPSRQEATIVYGGIEKKLRQWCKILVVTSR
ncbi:hypothetical protein WA026_017011 [Henosepilachna vigintioctopunctata]|uniref:Uncharacterized protein n=1 Tax=Henosepilachna vigintioctopunctata TaxID=420089 RepID=A0AAW1TV85_9CUCU